MYWKYNFYKEEFIVRSMINPQKYIQKLKKNLQIKLLYNLYKKYSEKIVFKIIINIIK